MGERNACIQHCKSQPGEQEMSLKKLTWEILKLVYLKSLQHGQYWIYSKTLQVDYLCKITISIKWPPFLGTNYIKSIINELITSQLLVNLFTTFSDPFREIFWIYTHSTLRHIILVILMDAPTCFYVILQNIVNVSYFILLLEMSVYTLGSGNIWTTFYVL